MACVCGGAEYDQWIGVNTKREESLRDFYGGVIPPGVLAFEMAWSVGPSPKAA